MQAYQVNKALAGRHKDDFFMTEVKNGPTQFGTHLRMDAIAIKKSWTHPCISIYEVKVSRGDFKQDEKWHLYRQYGNTFSFAVPEGLINKNEIPDGVGLLYVKDNGSIRTVVKPRFYAMKPDPDFLMYIIMNRLDSDRIPFFNNNFEYYQFWLEAKKTKQLVGRDIADHLNRSISEHQSKVNEFASLSKSVNEQVENLKKISLELRLHGINLHSWSDSRLLECLHDFIKNPINDIERAVKNRLTDVNGLKTSCLGALKSIGYDLEKEVNDIEKNRVDRLRGENTQLSTNENFHIL